MVPSPWTPRGQVQRDTLLAEKQVKELEPAAEACLRIEAEITRLQHRLEAQRRARNTREQALQDEIASRRESLSQVEEQLAALEANALSAPATLVFPALSNAEPLGESVKASVKDPARFGAAVGSSYRSADDGLDALGAPASWPSLESLGDLWLASAELEAALAWRETGRHGGRGPSLQRLGALDPFQLPQEVAEMADPRVLRAIQKENSIMQQEAETLTKLARAKLKIAADAAVSLFAGLGTQEMKRAELLQQQVALLQALEMVEQKFVTQMKMEAVHLPESQRPSFFKQINISEVRRIQNFLSWRRLLPSQIKEDAPDSWGPIFQRLRFSLETQRARTEQLRAQA